MEPNNEVDKFFADLPGEDKKVADIFAPETSQEVTGTGLEKGRSTDTPEEGEEPHKNRRHRRLEAQLDREREARIRAEAERDAARNTPIVIDPTVDERLVRLYGAENTEAQRLHMDLLRDFSKKAKEDAFKEMQDERAREVKEKAEYESLIGDELEAIEDEDGIDLTSNAPKARKLRNDLLTLVDRLSPKDEQGNIIAYADFGQAYDLLKAQSGSAQAGATTTERAKEIAGRTMQRGGVGQAAPKVPTPGFDGWKRDLGLE